MLRMSYSNVCDHAVGYRARREKGMDLDLIILHMGGVYGADKRKGFEEEGVWQGSFTISNESSYYRVTSPIAWSPKSFFAGRDQLGWGATWWVGGCFLLFAMVKYVGISHNKDLRGILFQRRVSSSV
jgi:hypothetical protein